MAQPHPTEVTLILDQIADGQPFAADKLFPLVYDELRALAGAFFRSQRKDHTLQPTALVHEAFARMVAPSAGSDRAATFNSRAHFLAVAAKAMRQILANHARDRKRLKRGGDWDRISLSDVVTPNDEKGLDLVAVDEVLVRLNELDARQSTVVELRFFADMTMPEIAHVLNISVPTVEREWRMARAWIAGELRRTESS